MLFVLFQVGKDRYALPASEIIEVLPLVELKSVPSAPAPVAGLFNYQGTPVPVIDLTQCMANQPARPRFSTRIILVKYAATGDEMRTLGLLAEHAIEAFTVRAGRFRRWRRRNGWSALSGAGGPGSAGAHSMGQSSKVTPGEHPKYPLSGGVGRCVMPQTEIELLLKKRMGLDAASIGRSCIERAVAQRMAACDVKKAEEYAGLVAGSEEELQELIEAVVVPETWFFRNREAFSALAQLAITEWLPANPSGTVRMLSIPCSSGEEPYSMAMAMVDAGVPLEHVHIDAVDISALSLQSAEAGFYRRNSFRGASLEFRDRHFTARMDGHHIHKDIQRLVHFRKKNLLDEGFLVGNPPYDFIFCRNLLIYFDQETQDRAVNTLTRLLSGRGVLFIGPSESGLFLRHDFVSAKIPLAFAFRKSSGLRRAQHPQTERPRKKAPGLPRAVAPPTKSLTLTPALKKPAVSSKIAHPAAKAALPLLDAAAKLADEGRLSEAAQLCDEHLREHGSSAQAYYLLGLVRDTASQPDEARKFYRKALYLDPEHSEALLHSAFLAQKCGDESGARALMERARRVNKKMS